MRSENSNKTTGQKETTMDKSTAGQEQSVGHIPSEKEHLDKAVGSLETELDGLATLLTPVLRSSTPSPTCESKEQETQSDCPLANGIASSRQTVQRLVGIILDLKDRLEV